MPEVWVMGTPTPDRWIDVTDTFEAKLAAIHSHASQLPDVDSIDERVRGWLTAQAQRGGLPEGRLAEAFMVVSTA